MAENTANHDWKCEGEFEDAPFCKGDSVIECWDGSQVPQHAICPSNPCEQAGTCDHTDPVPGTECEMIERSARGYCPGEEGHEEERCGTLAMAGEQGHGCPPLEDDATPAQESVTTAPTPTATPTPTEEIATESTTAPAPELPVTGPEMVPSLLGASLGMLALGIGILRKVRA